MFLGKRPVIDLSTVLGLRGRGDHDGGPMRPGCARIYIERIRERQFHWRRWSGQPPGIRYQRVKGHVARASSEFTGSNRLVVGPSNIRSQNGSANRYKDIPKNDVSRAGSGPNGRYASNYSDTPCVVRLKHHQFSTYMVFHLRLIRMSARRRGSSTN